MNSLTSDEATKLIDVIHQLHKDVQDPLMQVALQLALGILLDLPSYMLLDYCKEIRKKAVK